MSRALGTYSTLLVLFCSSAGLLAIPSSGAAREGDGLVASYPFDGNADDASGNSNDGVVTGAVLVADRSGNSSSAYSFDGEDDEIRVADDASLDITQAVTLSAWINPGATKSQEIVRKGEVVAAPYSFALSGTGDIVFSLRPGGALVEVRKAGYTLNEWTFLAATWDGAAMTLYENGTVVASMAQGGTLEPNASDLLIGTRLRLPANTFAGAIDDVTIWNRALSEAEIQDLMDGGSGGLVASYPFSGNADDVSGNDNHGTVSGAVLTTDRFGNPNSAYSFDGEDDEIRAADDTTFDITQAVTLAAWVYPEATKTQEIVRKGEVIAAPYSLALSSTGEVVFSLRPGGVLVQLRKAGYALDKWTFLAATWDGATMTLYENGTEVASVAQGGTLGKKASDLLIGTRLRLPADTFAGRIDDVTIWDRALSASEVVDLMGEAPGGLAASYPFDGDADDVSGNDNHGIVSGAVLADDRAGNPSSAYQFDGDNDEIRVSDDATLDVTQAITLAAWVYPEATKTQEIVRKGEVIAAPYSLALSSTGEVVFSLRPGGVLVQLRKAGYALDKWTFLAATWDGATMTLYENAKVVATQAQGGTLEKNASDLLIGTRLRLPADTFAGRIDEVSIWNTALSAEDVSDLMGPPVAIQATSWGSIKSRYLEAPDSRSAAISARPRKF